MARRSRNRVVPVPLSPSPMPAEAGGRDLADVQPAFLAARFGLTPAVAATVASLAWGR